jgi:Arc/MetJ-type ribon-helix-helix transcriptional regulator
VTVRAPESLVSDFDDAVAESPHANRSDALREAMRAFIGGRDTSDPGAADADARINDTFHLPVDEREREIYQACLEFSDEFVLVENRHYTLLAQNCQVQKGAIDANLAVLQRKGFVRRIPAPLHVKNAASRWRIKPPAADPEQWIYRREP